MQEAKIPFKNYLQLFFLLIYLFILYKKSIPALKILQLNLIIVAYQDFAINMNMIIKFVF